MSEKLQEIRKKIDSLDDRIHDLLLERADLIVDVSAAKKQSGAPIVQPAREAVMIRRLLARHRGPLPGMAIVRIWRELVGAVSLLQTGLKVAVSAENGRDTCWDMARDYFGSALPMVRVSSPLLAIAALREGESSFAVVPCPQDGEAAPWWAHLATQSPQGKPMRIVVAMPYAVSHDTPPLAPDQRCLVVARAPFLPSGDDRSFILLNLDRSISRTRLIGAFKALGLEVLSIFTQDAVMDTTRHLVEVSDYIAQDDDRLQALAAGMDELFKSALVLGGYPAPPVFDANGQILKPAPRMSGAA